MELVPVVCNRCGAPLQLPTNASYVTCQHCETRLAVRRNASLAWTEAIEQIGRCTEQLSDTSEQLANQVAQLHDHNAMARIDRDWHRRRDSLMLVDKRGRCSVPNEMASLFAGAFAVAMGVYAGTIIHPGIGFAIGVAGICGMMLGVSRARSYQQAYTQYRVRRSRMHIDHFLNATQPIGSSASDVDIRAE